jgi:hypothetical protein
MSSAKYQYPTPCKAEVRAVNRAGREAAQALPGPACSPKPPDPRARDLQRSIGNQGVLRLLRLQGETSAGGVAIRGAPQQADADPAQAPPAQAAPQVPSQAAPQPGQPAAPTASQPQPFSAMFSIAQHGSKAHQVCGLPDTPNCVVSWAKWRLVDATGAPVLGKVAVQETFTKISGPDDVFQKLDAQKNQSITSDSGGFDDCYGLCVPEGTPAFSLQVQQNYLVDGKIAAQNILSYSPTGVMIRVCQREPNGSFGTHCRRF